MSEAQHPSAPSGGSSAHWASSAKDGVGTAIDPGCRVWFTLSHGVVNEVYYPLIDTPNTRAFGLVVTDSSGFVSEEWRDTRQETKPLAPGVPGYRLINTCREGRYRIIKTVFADPYRDAILQKITFQPLAGAQGIDLRVYACLFPHVAGKGEDNRGKVGDYKGVPMLFASRDHTWSALACSTPWRERSVGLIGADENDPQNLLSWKQITQFAPEAGPGNIALLGEIDIDAASQDSDGAASFVLALAFGATEAEAGIIARSALLDSYEAMEQEYVRGWRAYQERCLSLDTPCPDLYRTGIAILKTHQCKRLRGGIAASLSVPWGMDRGDSEEIGYHVVWPRDQAKAAVAQIAVGDLESARDSFFYLMCTQEPDGGWPQNMWLDGVPHWRAVQADETALPVLLADLLRRNEALGSLDPWPTVRRAAEFLVRNGPSTEQDRWEANEGYSPFTLAVVIPALLIAAEMADERGETALAAYLRETADCWNAHIETWTFVRDTELARRHDAQGYYVRIAPPDVPATGAEAMGATPLKNRPKDRAIVPASEIVSPDCLALVRFGLRSPDDPRILDTLRIIDATLRTDTATGPVWHRYTRDGYGESADGSPYSEEGGGIGHGWPLLAGERALYELARGDRPEAERLLQVMAAQTSPSGMLPEQVWDAADIPERELFNGRPSGSAMPLVWTHAESLLLIRSLQEGQIFDTPPQPVARYRDGRAETFYTPWRFDLQSRSMPPGRRLRIEVAAPAVVRWSGDGWHNIQDTETRDTGLGIHVADLPTESLASGSVVRFTFCWSQSNSSDRWEGRDFSINVQP